MLSKYLQKVGCQTHHSRANSRRALFSWGTTMTSLFYCTITQKSALENYCFQPEPGANSTKRRVWNMKVLKEKLGQDVCYNIFFIHVILGCETTSRLHGIGKGTSLVLLKKEQPRMFTRLRSRQRLSLHYLCTTRWFMIFVSLASKIICVASKIICVEMTDEGIDKDNFCI